ncbi:uncharacterized protein [Eurosta solidaginis]|uniref:uncharacterized protein isoform X2 n=1 Tax=Eurosta solidaginis TaxID=178769 RepID=UPI003530B7AA
MSFNHSTIVEAIAQLMSPTLNKFDLHKCNYKVFRAWNQISTQFTRAASASNASLAKDDSEEYDDYYDESETDRNFNITVHIKSTDTRPIPSTTVTSKIRTTKMSKSLFDFSSLSSYFYPRSNHVVELICPKSCLCLEDYKHLLCNGAGLTQIPKDLPTTTLIIDLSENNITQLNTEDFANITKVREINLSGNRLSTIKKEIFSGLKHLQRIRLIDNQLTQLEPDTFSDAVDLSELDLSNNSILLRSDGPFLVQPSLLKFSCRNCSWTQLYDDTFTGLAGLNTLNLDFNDLDKKINTIAFTPLQNLIKLRLPQLEEEGVTELCNILKTIDNISFKQFDVSCFELVLGTPFNESVTLVTEPPYITPEIAIVPTKQPEAAPPKVNKEIEIQNQSTKPATTKPTKVTTTTTTERAVVDKQKEVKKGAKMSESSDFSNLTLPTTTTRVISSSPMSTILTAGVLSGAGNAIVNSTETTTVKTAVETENSHQVNISQETVNLLLICIIIVAIVGIIIGIICRKDVGGIKTKCCRTKKPEPKDQVHSTEEIPLNKLA